jgi:hypothetical protein
MLCLDAPVQKLLGLTSAFASLLNLQTLTFSVNPVHAPGKPPVPVTLFSQSTLPTPRESPALKAKSVLPQLLDYDQMNTQTCRSSDLNGDPSMPLLRDVKRFVRKCPKLEYLGIVPFDILGCCGLIIGIQSGMGKLAEVLGPFRVHRIRRPR